MARVPVPAEVLAVAGRDPAVRQFVALWECGDLSWEQAMMGAVIHLVKVNQRLYADLNRLTERATNIFVEKGKESL